MVPPENSKVLFQVLETDVVAIVIFLIALLGTCANSIVAFFTAKLPTMNNPFGRLTASQATGEAVLCGVFAFYFAPMVFFDSEWLKQHSKHAGWINLICYDICIWSHLFIALNRLAAIGFPMHYDAVFNKRNTKMMIIISWIIPIVTAAAFYKIYDCDFYYSPDLWAFVFSQNKVCNFISWEIDFYKDISIVIVIACVDIVTIINVRRLHKGVFGTTQLQKARRSREINFLKQAVLQGMVFVVELLTYFIFAWKFQNKWAIWSLTTLAWVLVHTTDGLIIILFNREFRGLVTKPLKNLHLVADKGPSASHGQSSVAVHPTTLDTEC